MLLNIWVSPERMRNYLIQWCMKENLYEVTRRGETGYLLSERAVQR